MKKLSGMFVVLLMASALLSGCYSTACTDTGKSLYNKPMKDEG